MNKYNDIINMEHFSSKNHSRMSIERRASIFSPFAALNGFDEKIKDTERFKDEKKYLEEDSKNNLNIIFIELKKDLKRKVFITYFSDDTYKKIECYIKKIDEINKMVILNDNKKILFDDIFNIEFENNIE